MNPTLHVVVVSTRDGRAGLPIAQWALERARAHGAFAAELVDLRDFALPLFDESRHPRLGQYERAHTRRWSAKVSEADAFVFVTPEYNYGAPPSLLNAIDYLAREWHYKPAGFVSYGGASGGTRAVQMAKQVVTTMRMMPLPEAVAIPFFTKLLDAEGRFAGEKGFDDAAKVMLDELARWTGALAALRG